MLSILETLKELVAPRCVSGNEEKVAESIMNLASPYDVECTIDPLGNLIVHKPGTGKKIMFAAHMDSIGLIATYIEKEGFVRFGKVGGISPDEIIHTPVTFKNGVRGVVCKEEKADMKKLSLEDLYIDIGANDEADAKKMIRVGDTAVYATDTFAAGNRVVSPYLDNRIGCLVLLMALSRMKKTENDVYFVFTAQEEVGLRGAKTSAYSVDPDYGFAVDVTGIGDVPGVKRRNNCKLGGGAAIKVMDSSIVCHPKAVELLERSAEKNHIPTQLEVLQTGGTDAGSIHISREGVPCGGVSIPTRYIHAPNEMADLNDIEACIALVAAAAVETL